MEHPNNLQDVFQSTSNVQSTPHTSFRSPLTPFPIHAPYGQLPFTPQTPTPIPNTQKKRKSVLSKENHAPSERKRPRTDTNNNLLPRTEPKSKLPVDEKCSLIFDLLKELGWTYGEMIYHTSHKDWVDQTESGSQSMARRHASIIQHFLHGKTKYKPIDIVDSWYRHPYGAKFEDEHPMFSLRHEYKTIQPVQPAISSFAAHIITTHLIKGAKRAVKTTSGLHVAVSKKKGRSKEASITWNDIGDHPIGDQAP